MRRMLLSLVGSFFWFGLVHAQTTITTNHTNNNGNGSVTFRVQNTNAYDIIVTDVQCHLGTTTTNNVQLLYNTTVLTDNVAPWDFGTVGNGQNGWMLAGSAALSNTNTANGIVNAISGMSLIIPAGQTYTLGFSGTTIQYMTLTSGAGVNTFTGGGVNLTTGDGISWGGTAYPSTPANYPRGFIGGITFIPAVPCTAPPTAGSAAASVNPVCPSQNSTLSITGGSGGTGTTYQWEQSTDGVTFTPISGATNSTYIASQTTATYYHAIVTCSGMSDITSAIYVTMNPFMNCYCTSIPSYTADEEIYNVTVNGGSTDPAYANANGCSTVAPGPGSVLNRYSSFTTLPAITSVNLGQTVSFSVDENECDGATYYYNGMAIWIDYNQNGSFSDPGEQIYVEGSTSQSPRTATGTFTVPTTAIPGNTVMRVIVAEGYSGSGLTPCMTYSYGETEDHIINIACPSLAAPSSSDVGVCNGNTATLTATANDPNVTLTWWDSPTGGTQVGTGTSYTTPVVTANATYYVQEEITGCTAGPRTAVNVIVSQVDVTLVAMDATCNGYANGSFTQTGISCGTAPFTYSVDGGAFGAIPTDLTPGSHSVVVMDANTFQSVAYPITINEPTAPAGLTVTNTTFFTATVDWTPQGDETDWVIEYGPTGFTLGTGTQVTASSHPYTITGLTENTSYEFYVRANCDPNSDFAGPQAFMTDPPFVAWDNTCGPGFIDISATGTYLSTTDDSQAGITLPWSWNVFGTIVNTVSVSNNGGLLFNSLTGYLYYTSGGPGMYPFIQDLNTPNAGGGVYYQSIGTAPNRQFIIEWKDLTHYTYPAATDGATFEIIVDEATGDIWYLYDDVLMSNTSWDYGADAEIKLITSTNTTTVSSNNATYLTNNSCVHFYGALCPNITSVSSMLYPDEGDLNWSAGLYGETEWTVVYGPQGFDPAAVPSQAYGTFTQTTADIQLTGLTQLTTYDVYIYSECTADNLESSGYMYEFTTLPWCADPTNVVVGTDIDSLELTWNYAANSGYDPTSYSVQYGWTGFGLGSGTEAMLNGVNSADTVHDASLMGGGVYQVYLQATCGTDTSNWVGPVTVVMPLTNDLACSPDTLMVGQMGYVFNNTGATVTTGEDAIAPPATGAQTTTGWTNSTLNKTTWFMFQAPATGSVRINCTAIEYNNQIAVYTAADCSVFSTYQLLAANDNEIGGSSVASNFTVCGLTPGQYYYMMSDAFDNTTGNYAIAVTEIVLNAGSANPVTNVCSGLPVDLTTTIGGNDAGGTWMSSIPAVDASITGSTLTTAGLAYTTYDLQYRVTDGCAYDSILSQVHIYGPSQAGTDGTVTVCKHQSVNLYTALTGTVDFGGTWYDPSNAPITGSQITASGFAGSYNYDYIVNNGVCPNDTSNVIVVVSSTCDALGLDEAAFAGVNVYPNPSTGLVNISSDVAESFDLKVTDIDGRLISEVKGGVTNASIAKVDLSKVERGVYLIHLSNTTAEKTFRVVIQ